MGKTMRAIMARRLKFTDELLANVRQRFETSDELLSTMAADLGCCKTTLRGIAQREGWLRYVAPPRELLPAARLLAQAEALSLPPRSGGEGRPPELAACPPKLAKQAKAEAATADGVGGIDGVQEPPTPDPSPPFAARMGGGESSADTAEALHAAVVKELAEFKVQRAKLKGKPLGLLERERAARTLAGLTRTLHTLQAMRCGVPPSETHSDNDYDDMPADLDEFREALARKIEAFMESRGDEADAFELDADGDDAARS